MGGDRARALLLLFDVDGTLVGRASEAHAAALRAAVREVHGIDAGALDPAVSPAGRTDGEIARLLLSAAGVPGDRIDARADQVREACARFYAELCPASLADKVLPGVVKLLSWLASRPDVKLSLVTGNYEPVARLKLARAGLGDFFAPGQGAFGSDAEDRVALPPLARRRARDRGTDAGTDGTAHPRGRTLVIGDTPRDIACARADAVRCVAVTTGPFAAAELAAADSVARTPDELRAELTAALADGQRGGQPLSAGGNR